MLIRETYYEQNTNKRYKNVHGKAPNRKQEKCEKNLKNFLIFCC